MGDAEGPRAGGRAGGRVRAAGCSTASAGCRSAAGQPRLRRRPAQDLLRRIDHQLHPPHQAALGVEPEAVLEGAAHPDRRHREAAVGAGCVAPDPPAAIAARLGAVERRRLEVERRAVAGEERGHHQGVERGGEEAADGGRTGGAQRGVGAARGVVGEGLAAGGPYRRDLGSVRVEERESETGGAGRVGGGARTRRGWHSRGLEARHHSRSAVGTDLLNHPAIAIVGELRIGLLRRRQQLEGARLAGASRIESGDRMTRPVPSASRRERPARAAGRAELIPRWYGISVCRFAGAAARRRRFR